MIAQPRKRLLASLATVGAAALVLVGCGSAPETPNGGGNGTTTPPEAGNNGDTEEVDFLACAVSDEGSWNDKSFNQAAYGGLEMAETELGIDIADAESHSIEDFDPNLEQMVAAGCNVTFAVGFNIVDQVNNAAVANPDYNFVTVDGFKHDESTPNLKAIVYNMAESSFLAGYLSAAYSTTKVVGTYGGMNIPAVTDFMLGFHNGAKYYAQEQGIEVTVLGYDPANPDSGDFVGDFGNTGVAKSISEGQIEADADVILPVAGGLFSATSEAINESGKDIVMLGVDENVALTSPQYADQVLTSVEKLMTQAVFDVIESSLDGSFSGDAYLGTLENGGTRLSPLYDFESKVDAEVLDRLAEIEADLISGAIDPTVTP